jgi:2',3'-cyclic-nucleotide 2'-phosphodiesterase (5'-nucleotidase family)
LRRAYPGQVLLVDSGDLIQGDPFAAYFARVAPQDTNPMIRAMNLVGYDAATLGNHEFNWVSPRSPRRWAEPGFPT